MYIRFHFEDFIIKLQEEIPNIDSCSAVSIANVHILALHATGIAIEQLATVFTFTQLEGLLMNNVEHLYVYSVSNANYFILE